MLQTGAALGEPPVIVLSSTLKFDVALGLIILLIVLVTIYVTRRPPDFDPNEAYLHLQRGSQKQRSGDMSGAEAEYTEAIRLDPRLTSAYLARCSLYLQLSRLEETIADADKVIEFD